MTVLSRKSLVFLINALIICLALSILAGCAMTPPPQDQTIPNAPDYQSSLAPALIKYHDAETVNRASWAEHLMLERPIGEKIFWKTDNSAYVIGIREATLNGKICREFNHVFMTKDAPEETSEKRLYSSICK